MKFLLVASMVFCACAAFSQQTEFHLQGQVIDSHGNPVSDAYVINYRDQRKNVTRANGVFDVWILPKDSLFVTHVTYLRKIITAFDLLKNPIIVLKTDTVNIDQVDVFSTKRTDIELAKENIRQINFDPRPQINDDYTESERMHQLLNTENKVERAAANSLTYQFSPSAVIGKIIDRIKLRRQSNEYFSTKKSTKKQEPD